MGAYDDADDDDTPTDLEAASERHEETRKIHFPSFFLANFGISLAASGDAVAAHGTELASHPRSRQRSILFGLDERLRALEFDIASGRHLIREFMDVLETEEQKQAVTPAPPSWWSRVRAWLRGPAW
jgi:hypothetical protein